ncbi:hypothetical protein GCM10023094_25460 [Rhodococcus olei]|uniref:Blue pigment (Indigoidine) exporter n=1 Tax=Rhodococcus olei TaxID=2161675 RepID=A0ABP8P191_9NOCA
MTTTTTPAPLTTTAARTGWTALTAIAPAVWGTTYIVTTHLLPAGHPLFAALMRSLPAGLIALLLSRRLPHGSWWWKSAVLGVLNMGAFFPLLFLAAQHLPGGVAATLGAAQPIVVAFLAVAILHERLSTWRIAWGVVGVLGVALVVLGPGAALDPIGLLAGLAGAVSMGTGVVLTKRWGRPDDVGALGLAGWQLTAAGLVLLAPALLVDGIPPGIDGPAVAGYLWLGLVGALLSYTIWFAGIRRLPVTATALLGLLSPLVAAILGATLAGEALTLVQLAGFAVALTAMVAGQFTPRHAPVNEEGTHPVMKIAVFGATGMAGSAIVTEALTRGHVVTALSRRPDVEVDRDRLAVQALDVADPDTLDPVLAEVDTAVLSIRLAPGDEQRLAPLTHGFLDAAARSGTRVLVVGGSAPLRSPDDPDRLVIDDPNRVPDGWRAVAQASLDQFRVCQDHPYGEWTYVSPPAVLEPGARAGRYRRGVTTLLTDDSGDSRITAGDLAIAVVDELESPGDDRHFTVARDHTA